MTMPIKHQIAIDTIAKPIFEGGIFDYSKKEKVFYFFFTPIAAAYASYESVKFYLKIGGDGTKYLPIGNFSKEFGAQCAFWSNFTFNWFYMIDTIIDFRNAYYHYQYAKQLGIPTSIGKIITKITIATALSIASGTMFALIAGNEHGTYNQIETGFVNTFLNFLGSLALQIVTLFILSKVKDTLYRLICLKAGLDEEEFIPDFDETINGFEDTLDQKTETLEKMGNNNPHWERLGNYSHYLNEIQSTGEETPLLHHPKKPTKLTLTELWVDIMRPGLTLKNLALFSLHTMLQVFDKISLYGWWKDTMANLQNKPFHFDKPAANGIGTGIFIPFVGLSSKVTYDTLVEMLELLKTGYRDAKEFIDNPVWTKETFISLTGKVVTGTLSAAGYFFAYVASNSGLGLNAKHGWNNWWNVYPTAGGTTLYNGFGFFKILLTGYNFIMPYLLTSPEKRKTLGKHQQVTGFFKSYPDAVNHLAKKETIGLQPMSDTLFNV